MTKQLFRIALALWLGVTALAANMLEQQQLTGSLLMAAAQPVAHDAASKVPSGFHVMPDGTLMAGATHHQGSGTPGGHTHEGHADCAVCGAAADMAAFALPVLPVLPPPPGFAAAPPPPRVVSAVLPALYTPHASRAPPLA